MKRKIKKTFPYWFLLGAYESRRIETSDVYGEKRQQAYDKGRALAHKWLNKAIKVITIGSVSL